MLKLTDKQKEVIRAAVHEALQDWLFAEGIRPKYEKLGLTPEEWNLIYSAWVKASSPAYLGIDFIPEDLQLKILRAKAKPLRAYYVWLDGEEEHVRVINATSASQARREYHLSILDPCPDVRYIDIRSRVCSRRYKGPWTTDNLRKIAEYRGFPFAKAGQLFKYRGDFGIIVDGSDSGGAYFDVMFLTGDYAGRTVAIHPGDMIICVTGTAVQLLRKPKYYETNYLEAGEVK